jgi:hypothetical protein
MTPEFAAYKDEMRQVALPLRLGGLLGVMLGCALLIASTKFPAAGLVPLGFACLGLGWGVTGYAIWLRTQWAKANPFTGPR